MMRKLFLFVAACLVACVTQTVKAYENVFNFAENYASREVKDKIVSFKMPGENDGALIQLEVITDKEYYDSYFSYPRKIDILIVSEDFYDSSVKKHNISQN